MSKSDILQELPNLGMEDRREIFERICEIEEKELPSGGGPRPEEKAMLDRELEDYRRTPAAGSPWHEVEARLRKQTTARNGTWSSAPAPKRIWGRPANSTKPNGQAWGDEFLAEMKRVIRFLEEHPGRRPAYYRDFRRVMTGRFPYELFYRIEGDQVVVFRVLHAKRHHPRWL